MPTQRYLDLERFLSSTSKSGLVNVTHILSEMASELGLDVDKAIMRPLKLRCYNSETQQIDSEGNIVPKEKKGWFGW